MLSWLAAFAYWRGLTRLRPAATLGALVLRPGRAGALVGGIIHLVVGTLAFPALYAVAFRLAGQADAPIGAALGLAHGCLAGLAVPFAWRGAGHAGSAGALGMRLGAATPFGIVATHVLYGALLGYIYVVPA